MRRNCPKCGSTSVVMFDADEDWCTQCKERFPGASFADTSLQQQLTAALAERDEARERVKELEAQATAPGYPYQTLKGMVASLEGCNQRQADTIRQYKTQFATAWQQGAEAFREAAAKRV